MIKLIIIILITLPIGLFGQWEKISESANFEGLNIFILPDNPDFIVVSGDYGNILKSEDGGNQWQDISLKDYVLEIVVDHRIEKIKFIDEQTGFLTIEDLMLRSTDGGENWFILHDFARYNDPPYIVSVRGFEIFGDSIVSADIGTCETSLVFFASGDSGKTFEQIPYQTPDTTNAVHILKNKDDLYLACSGYILKTPRIDSTPNIVERIPNDGFPDDISVKNSSVLVPFSNGCFGDRKGGGMVFIAPSGESHISYTDVSMFGCELINDSTGFAVGDSSTVLFTNNYGKSWQSRNLGIDSAFSVDDICFSDENTGFCCGDGGIYRWTGGPVNVQRKSAKNPVSYRFDHIRNKLIFEKAIQYDSFFIYDLNGQKVKSLGSGFKSEFNLSDLISATYFFVYFIDNNPKSGHFLKF